jgi:hypothetical protein
VTALEADTQKLKAAMTNELTPAITSFAGQLQRGIGTVKQALDKLGISQKTTGEKIGGVVGGGAGMVGGGMAGAATGAALGSLVGPIGTIVGGLIGGAIGSWGGGEAGASVGEWAGSKFAVGGIVDRPTRALIGEAGMPEAIIPMPNGKGVPVSLDMSSMMANMKDMSTGGNDMVKAIENLNSTMSGVMNKLAGADSARSSDSEGMSTMLEKQFNEMIGHLRDHKDVSQKLLNVMA